MQEVFKYPINILYMILPVLALAIMIFGYRKKSSILRRLKLGLTMKYEKLRIVIMFISLILICISLMGPQILKGTMKVNRDGLDIYVLLDTSKSMLVEDVAPNRLEREKQIINNMLSQLKGDRIGFIPFSSSAYVQMPLTDDYNMAKMFLEVVDTDMIGGGGSNVGKAIKLASESFDRSSTGDKVILIISDGEEHDKKSEEALKKLKDKSLKVYSIGIGTKKGGLIPVYDEKGDNQIGYKKDSQGNHVMSKLHDETLKSLADIGNGRYYSLSVQGDEANQFISNISTLKKSTSKTKNVKRYTQLFQYVLAVGMVLFLVAYLMPVRRRDT